MMRAFVVALLLLAVAPHPAAQQTTQPSPNDLVGTWTLVSTDEGGAGGQRVPNPRGLLIVDGAGHVFETVSRATRQQPAGAAPRLTDQQLTFAMYSGF